MRELEKITLNGVRYIVWDEARGRAPRRNGIALLLSAHDGVGADVLLVLPKGRPLALRACAGDGSEIAVDDGARRAASLALRNLALLAAGKEIVAEETADRVEVRLTDCFCTRLFAADKRARIAG
ncbi:MAG: hypothetical protein IJ812_00955 [Schwartzia sp.]|nr:hypothetical protein [Schwartzia sp. (in: firmicutes)]MBR1884953.1 hypothetical protein [Schwartzia sp. (in: firmicutes)]